MANSVAVRLTDASNDEFQGARDIDFGWREAEGYLIVTRGGEDWAMYPSGAWIAVHCRIDEAPDELA